MCTYEPAGFILVERNSSPTTAVLFGTIIGDTSKNSPVFTNNVFVGSTSAGTPVSVCASIALIKISSKDSAVACASASSIFVASIT